MAKFKPHRVPVLLKGGPCDGTKTTARRTLDLLDSVTCKGTVYDPTDRVTAAGRVVYTPRSVKQQPPPTTSSSAAKPLKAHHSWHHMMRDVFVEAPKELIASQHARKAMHALRSRRGLR